MNGDEELVIRVQEKRALVALLLLLLLLLVLSTTCCVVQLSVTSTGLVGEGGKC